MKCSNRTFMELKRLCPVASDPSDGCSNRTFMELKHQYRNT